MSDRKLGFVATVLVWLVWAPGMFLADDTSEPSTDFFETVEVNVVNVEVYVSDKKGNPVTGLTPADFEVFEDGEPVEITNFYTAADDAGGAGAAPKAVAAVDSEPASPPPPAPRRRSRTPEDQRLKLLIFVDNMNIRPVSRNRVLEALRGSMFFNLNPDDEVMLVSYNGGSLDVSTPLTNDPNDLVAAIEALTKVNPRGAHQQLDRIAIMRELQQVDLEENASAGGGFSQGGTTDWDGLFTTIQNYAHERYQETVRTVGTMKVFVDSLSGLTGRKALIYVSDGLSLRPGEALYHAWDNKRSQDGAPGLVNIESAAREVDVSPLLEDLSKHANSNRVTFYTILANGGLAHTMSPAERAAHINVASAPASTLGQVWNDQLEAMEASNYRGSMRIMAEATGGLATLNTTAIGAALQRLRRDFDTYYSLGYVSPHDADGKDHKIKVRMKDNSLKARHREGYRAKTGDERMSDRVQSALMFEGGDNPLQVVIGFGEEKQDEKGRFLVPIMVKFPIANLLLLPQEHFHEGRVSIFVGARNSQGGTSPVQKMPTPIRIPNDKLLTALGQVAGFRVTLMMQEGEHAVVVGVRDELANVESTTRVSHTPGQPSGEEVAAAPGVS